MTRKLFITMALFSGLATPLSTSIALADVVQIPVGQQSAEKASVKRPATGATKAQVEEAFGEPVAKKDPRGTPPISSWEYEEFVVYFEHDHVIHSVLKHRPYVD